MKMNAEGKMKRHYCNTQTMDACIPLAIAIVEAKESMSLLFDCFRWI